MSDSRAAAVRSACLATLLAFAVGLRLWYASEDPSANRFYDERFAIENIVAIVGGGSLEPANGYHPALSFLPATAAIGAAELLHRTLGWPARSPIERDDLTAAGYLLGRALHAILGALAVWLTVRLGERLFSSSVGSSSVGLLAGLMVAAAPLHIRQSSMINEDVILAVTSLLAAHATLGALERPSSRRFLAAGGSFGLALASKFNGGVFSLPLAGVALWRGRRDRRQLAGLGLAVAASIAVFLALNPYLPARLELYQRDFGQTARLYDQRGAQHGTWHVVVHSAQTMARWDFLGPVLGTLGLVALLTAAILLYRQPAPVRDRWLVLVAFPAVYIAALAAPAVHVSGHQWLPLLPFWSIAAAQTLCWAAARWRLPIRLALPLAAALALAIAGRGLLFVRGAVVEMPADCAARYLASQLAPGPAVAFTETPLRGIRRQVLRGVVAVAEIEDLSALPPARLDAADAIVFPSRRSTEPAFRDWLASARAMGPMGMMACAPGPLASGEELTAAVRPIAPAAPSAALRLQPGPPGAYSGGFSSAPGELVSFLLIVPRDAGAERNPELLVGGTATRLIWLRTARDRDQYLTERLAIGAGEQHVALTISPPSTPAKRQRQPQVRLLRWQVAGAADAPEPAPD